MASISPAARVGCGLQISKICSHFGAGIYPFPEAKGARQSLQSKVEMQLMGASAALDPPTSHARPIHEAPSLPAPCTLLARTLYPPCLHPAPSLPAHPPAAGSRPRAAEMREVVRHTNKLKKRSLAAIAAGLGTWSLVLERERATLHALNQLALDPQRKVFVAEGWVPTSVRHRLLSLSHVPSQLLLLALPWPACPPLACLPDLGLLACYRLP